MVLRRPLSVAACTLALFASTLAAPMPAQADATQSAALSASLPALPASPPRFPAPPHPASPPRPASPLLPEEDKVRAAKEDPAALTAMVSQIEALIAASTQDLLEAEAAALGDQDAYAEAATTLAELTTAATEARTQADRAAEHYSTARTKAGQIAGDLYRNGGIAPGVPELFESTGNNDVLYKASTMEALAARRARAFSAAQQSAALWTEWENYAAQAAAAAGEAAGESLAAREDAARTQAAYAARLAAQEEVRAGLIAQLAFLRDTSVAQEERRIAAKEAAAREAALAAALAAAPSTPAATAPAPRAAAPEPPARVPDAAPASGALVPGGRDEAEALPAPVAAPPKASSPQASSPQASSPQSPAQQHAPAAAPATKPPAAPSPAAPSPATPAAPAKGPEPADTARPASPLPATSQGIVEPAIRWAVAAAADPSVGYRYGGNGPALYDCSAFTRSAFARGGLSLPRTSTQQYFAAPHKVPLGELKRGDLVFWSSNGGASFYHVAIYLGNGQIVHARNPAMGVSVTALNYAGMYNIYPYAGRY